MYSDALTPANDFGGDFNLVFGDSSAGIGFDAGYSGNGVNINVGGGTGTAVQPAPCTNCVSNGQLQISTPVLLLAVALIVIYLRK
jgi:hypothetical protein